MNGLSAMIVGPCDPFVTVHASGKLPVGHACEFSKARAPRALFSTRAAVFPRRRFSGLLLYLGGGGGGRGRSHQRLSRRPGRDHSGPFLRACPVGGVAFRVGR